MGETGWLKRSSGTTASSEKETPFNPEFPTHRDMPVTNLGVNKEDRVVETAGGFCVVNYAVGMEKEINTMRLRKEDYVEKGSVKEKQMEEDLNGVESVKGSGSTPCMQLRLSGMELLLKGFHTLGQAQPFLRRIGPQYRRRGGS